MLVVATLSAACSGISNWSHDVAGYLGHRLVQRAPPELLVRWLQFGCYTPLMHAHARMPQEPWHYSERVLELYRGYVLASGHARCGGARGRVGVRAAVGGHPLGPAAAWAHRRAAGRQHPDRVARGTVVGAGP